METVTLNNGIEMPILGLGTMRVKNLREVIPEAIAAGYRLIDTAANLEAVPMKRRLHKMLTALVTGMALLLPGLAEADQFAGLTPGAEDTSILIAYFSWANSTAIEEPERFHVDAMTSASAVVPGNTGLVAQRVQQATGGDLFEIATTALYSSDYDTCLEEGSDQLGADVRPELRYQLKDLDKYDVVFLGFPNWWYSLPRAIRSFLDAYDLSGKTVIPFVTHGTGGLSGTVRELTACLPDSAILDSYHTISTRLPDCLPEVDEWIEGLGLAQ